MTYPRDDRLFEHLKAKSPFLEAGNRSHLDPDMWRLADVRGLNGLYTEYAGKLERCEGLLTSIGEELERRKVQARREGKTEPTELPPDLAETAGEIVARRDVLRLEIAFIQKKLAEAETRVQKKQDSLVLRDGPIGSGKMRDGILAEIDFQEVRPDKDGFLRIACPKSPYHKMLVSDYREKVVKPFLAARAQKARDWHAMTPEQRRAARDTVIVGDAVAWKDLPARPKGV
jgi:hypothetical protein